MVALSLVGAVTGCGGQSSSSSGDKNGPEKQTITVAGLPLADVAGLHIAQQRKLFAEEGLTVRIQPVQQSIQALPALAKGQVDVVAGANYVTLLQAQEKGTLSPVALADGATLSRRMMGVLAMPGSGIDKAEDLRGKKVAVNILHNIQSLTLDTVVTDRTGDERSGIAYRQIPFPQMGVALEKGQVDAAHVAEPFLTDIKRKLGARLVTDGGGGQVAGLPISGYVTTRKFADKYPRTSAAFQRAVAKGQKIAAADRADVEKVLPGYARIDAKTASRIGLPGYPVANSEKRIGRLSALMKDAGLLKKEPRTGGFFFTGKS
ncbi:ABC transporter substrate-binding protein [Streptomyces sp. HNM0575]|uniref:ABC transporter substrate-binding protein n=1 Tax=Streptomyces sp. HNM0575 TaxID=2716338 RepID=UPI001F11174D|nr:ABC transporter substrate-binding protein [Streptomyces sp. HNM0575]